MSTAIAVQMTPQGLLIPPTAIQGWGEVEVVKEKQCIIIRPKALTPQQERELAIQALREDGLLVQLDQAPLHPPATPEERTALARKLSIGKPLSEIIIEERRAGW